MRHMPCEPYSFYTAVLSAFAAIASVAIAGVVVFLARRESPDIRLMTESVDIIVENDRAQNYGAVNTPITFQNVGARAGSLIGVKFTCPAPSSIRAELRNGLPKVLQPYTATEESMRVSIITDRERGIKLLLDSLGDRAMIEVSYRVTTKSKKPETRTGYVKLNLKY